MSPRAGTVRRHTRTVRRHPGSAAPFARSPRFPVALTLAVSILAGCGPLESSANEPVPDDDAVVIRVAHDVRSANTLTIYLFTPFRSRIRLGPLRPGGFQEFRLGEEPVSGSYRLAAELPDGRVFTSRSFILLGRDGVEWSPGADLLTTLSNR